MKKIIYLFAIAGSFMFYSAKAQDIKQYNGAYNDGTATYSYYEREDGSRVMHGKFSAKKDDATKFNSKYTYNIRGQYVEDKRDGEWVIDFTNVTNKITFSGKLTINYKNGQHSGPYLVDIKANGTIDVAPEYNAAIFSPNNCFLKFDCVDNNANGPVEIRINDFVLKGQATDGIMNGLWTISERYLRHTYDFENGSGYTIDVETGDRLNLEKFPRYSELLKFLSNYVGFYESLTDPGNSTGNSNPRKYSGVNLRM